jgi:CDP-4-dehydro-6-deoxyglucose reductase, E1
MKTRAFIPLIKSTYFNEGVTKKRLAKFITTSEVMSCSKECSLFEKNFSAYQSRKYTVLVNSGSSANLAIIQALINLKRLNIGDTVGFSALTWSTNVMPLIQLGLKPIPIDVELTSLNVSALKLLESLRTHPIKLLFLTNLLGFCDDIDMIREICKIKNIILVEDNCESLGSVYKGVKLGNWGLASTFSFYVGHHMSTIEGGAVCTDDEELATMLKLVRAHGWDRNLSLDKQTEIRKLFHVNSTFYSRYTFYDLGYNLRPTEITGFLGNDQLQYINQIVKIREANFRKLEKIYSMTNKYYPINVEHMDFVSNFAFPIICRTEALRKRLVEKCANKVEIRPIVGGNMARQPFYIKHMPALKDLLGKNSNADLIHTQGLYIGNNPELTDQELDFLVEMFTTN